MYQITPALSGFKQHAFIISQCLCSGVQTQLSWILCFRVSHKIAVKVWAQGLSEGCSQGQLEQDLLPSSLSCCWQDSVPHRLLGRGSLFLVGCWLEATFTSLPLGPFPHGSLLHSSQQERGSASKWEVTLLYNPFMEMTPHYFCPILFLLKYS